MNGLIDSFNNQIERINEAKIPLETAHRPLHLTNGQYSANGLIRLGLDRLQLIIRKERLNHGNLQNSQGVRVGFNISSRRPHHGVWSEGETTAYRFNSDGESLQGWSVVRAINKERNGHLMPYLFFDNGFVYNLDEIQTTEKLLSTWMIRLFEKAEQGYTGVL